MIIVCCDINIAEDELLCYLDLQGATKSGHKTVQLKQNQGSNGVNKWPVNCEVITSAPPMQGSPFIKSS